MKFTNKFNLPAPVVHAIEAYMYRETPRVMDGTVFGVTTLLRPVQATLLEHEYRDEIESDVSDYLYILGGMAMDQILTRAGETDKTSLYQVKVARAFGPVLVRGIADNVHFPDSGGKVIGDFKWTSVWSVKFAKEEWRRQLEIYDLLLGGI